MLEEYDEMDENELADIMDTAHDFNVPNEANRNDDKANAPPVFENEEEEIVFEDENNEAITVDNNTVDDDEDYEDSNQEDEPLEADEENPDEDPNLRRTALVRTPNPRYGYQHLSANVTQTEEYMNETASIIAYVMCHFKVTMVGMNDVEAYSFLQTYSLNQGLKKFGEQGRKAAHKEIEQLHDRVVFKPIHIKDMTALERKRAMESLIFLAESTAVTQLVT
jgi:hypothetical protein